MKRVLFLFLTITLFSSCGKDELSLEEQTAVDKQLIEDYLKTNSLTAQVTGDGLYYIVDAEGSAEKPKVTSQVTVTYKGYFLDGSVFDQSEKAKFALYSVIQGWQIGIPKFGRGGKGKLLIPSRFGYGTSEVGGRTSAVLLFDIEVFDF
ncbi:MAG: FKBP-type peptidyl-prolyl cis-trans isomerase [Saprospiraceae bacterium]